VQNRLNPLLVFAELYQDAEVLTTSKSLLRQMLILPEQSEIEGTPKSDKPKPTTARGYWKPGEVVR
jgi:hypothetical protein